MAVEIDYLCRHIRLDGFDCGNALLNTEIEHWLTQPPDPREIAVFVAHDNDKLRGFVAVQDLWLKLGDNEPLKQCFFVAAWAADLRVRGSDVGRALNLHWRRIQRRRSDEGASYAALVFSSFFDLDLIRRYRRQGFTQLNYESALWFKRLPER